MRVLIIGAGETGKHLARALSKRANEVIIVDKDREKCEAVATEGDVMAINRDATDLRLYEEDVDLRKVDVLVAVTDRDEVNLFVAIMAKDYGVPRVIVRVKDVKVASLLEKSGVEKAICVPYVTAKLIEGMIEGKYSIAYFAPTFTGNYGLASISLTESDSSIGKRIEDVSLPPQVKILAIFDGEELLDPEEITELKPGYEIIALVRGDKVKEFIEAFR